MDLQRLISFDIAMKADLATEHCKTLKSTTAVLTFKIADTASLDNIQSGYKLKTIECSLDELKKFREELAKIQDAM